MGVATAWYSDVGSKLWRHVPLKAWHKIVISFCGNSKIFQRHASVHSKIKLPFFQECIILLCFMHTEFYLVLKQCCIKETAQL